MSRKHKPRVMGHTMFVPIDPSLEVEVTANFHTGVCEICNNTFHSWKKSKYCNPSHKAMAHRKRKHQEMREELERLRERIEQLEGSKK